MKISIDVALRGALIAVLLFGAVAYTMAADANPYRAWTSIKGSTLDALLVRQSGSSVLLKNTEGKQLTIALSQLSQSDRDYLSEVIAAQRLAADKRRASFFARTSGGQEGARKDTRPDYLSEDECQVMEEMNLARTDPKGYAKWLKQYRSGHIGNNVFTTNHGQLTTKEGLAAVDEAIRFLETRNPIEPITPSEGLTSAARDHADDIGAAGIVGHTGSTGSTLLDRVGKHGKWKSTTGENIQFGRGNARDIIMQLIIDDGVPGRGHRTNIFNPSFKVAGIAIGAHARYTFCCVIDYAGGFSD
jgi:uncharacterized protein YkwD